MSDQQTAEKDAHRCPECDGTEWSTGSDGLGDVMSVAAVCLSCRYVTVSVADLGSVIPAECSDCGCLMSKHGTDGCHAMDGNFAPCCCGVIPPGLADRGTA